VCACTCSAWNTSTRQAKAKGPAKKRRWRRRGQPIDEWDDAGLEESEEGASRQVSQRQRSLKSGKRQSFSAASGLRSLRQWHSLKAHARQSVKELR
jgi:hypothetical protein